MKSSKVQLLPSIMEEIGWFFTNKKLIFVFNSKLRFQVSSNCSESPVCVMQIPTSWKVGSWICSPVLFIFVLYVWIKLTPAPIFKEDKSQHTDYNWLEVYNNYSEAWFVKHCVTFNLYTHFQRNWEKMLKLCESCLGYCCLWRSTQIGEGRHGDWINRQHFTKPNARNDKMGLRSHMQLFDILCVALGNTVNMSELLFASLWI